MASDSAGVGSALPSQVGQSGNYLTTDGTVATWAAVAGGTGYDTIGAFDSTPNDFGLSASGTTLSLAAADGTHPGAVTSAAQVFGGKKTMAGVVSTVGALVTGTPAAGSSSGISIGQDATFAAPMIWIGQTTLDLAHCAFYNSSGTTQVVNGVSAVALSINGTNRATLSPTTLDLTALGNSGQIKLKSADGTTYTATIANGGTWSIA